MPFKLCNFAPTVLIFPRVSVIRSCFRILNWTWYHSIPTRIFYRWVSGFATDCHYGAWGRGLAMCLLYVNPLVWKSSWSHQLVCKFDITGNGFFMFILFIDSCIDKYRDISWYASTHRYVFAYIAILPNMITLDFLLPYFCVSNSALYLLSALSRFFP